MLRFRGRERSCGDPIKARKGPAQSSGHVECRAKMKQMQVLAYGKHRLAQRLLESGNKTKLGSCYSELRANKARHLNLKHAPTDFIIQAT